MVKLEGQWRRNAKTGFAEPRYDHPYFQEAFNELNGLLAAELNGNPLIEYMETFMYEFWARGARGRSGTTRSRTIIRPSRPAAPSGKLRRRV
jgi:hypothetical protein